LHVDPYVDHEFHYSTQEQALLWKYTQADRKLLVDFADFSRKQCSAGRNCVNLLPDGQLFTGAGGVQLMHSPLYPELVRNKPLGHYRMGNIFDPEFRLNSSDLCELPCKDACDRDDVLVKIQRYDQSN
jgi:hypothetical protein